MSFNRCINNFYFGYKNVNYLPHEVGENDPFECSPVSPGCTSHKAKTLSQIKSIQTSCKLLGDSNILYFKFHSNIYIFYLFFSLQYTSFFFFNSLWLILFVELSAPQASKIHFNIYSITDSPLYIADFLRSTNVHLCKCFAL